MPRALLICCEGKTEEQYFNILLDFHRPPAYVEVEVYGQEGQHIALIDNTVAKRVELCAGDDGFAEDEIYRTRIETIPIYEQQGQKDGPLPFVATPG